MESIEKLRAIVAKLGEVDPGQIGTEFSLQTALKSSIKRAAMAATIRRDLGVNSPAVHNAATFGELAHAVLGKGSPAATGASPAPAAPVAATPSAAAPVPPFSLELGEQGLRCGVDIEMVNELPETTDYREHEFYRDSFTPEEIAYCVLQSNPRLHFAARWCAKEALYKCDPGFRTEPMSNVEVARTDDGEVFLRHHQNGKSRTLSHALSLSHTELFAIALVVAGVDEGRQTFAPTQLAKILPQQQSSISGLQIASLTACIMAIGLALFALIRTL